MKVTSGFERLSLIGETDLQIGEEEKLWLHQLSEQKHQNYFMAGKTWFSEKGPTPVFTDSQVRTSSLFGLIPVSVVKHFKMMI